MALPPLIEVQPLGPPAGVTIVVPGSKSITNRALVLAALARGETILNGALWSEDTQVMVDCLQYLGYMVNVERDPRESANRTITVYPLGGKVPRGGTEKRPLELFVGNSGTTARFLAALVALGGGVYRLHGEARMHERPQSALFQALRDLGYRVTAENERLPVVIHGGGARSGRCRVSIQESSQFASGLLLGARAGQWEVQVVGENAEESPYVGMTRQMVARFPEIGGRFDIEPDTSSGSYFWAAGWLGRSSNAGPKGSPSALSRSAVGVAHWPATGWQMDEAFPRYLPLPGTLSRQTDLGDSILTAMILAPFSDRPVRFTDLGRLRLQECERVAAMKTELGRCGATVVEEAETLLIQPGPLHGATIETYEDHRLAMCFATLGLKVPGIRIKNPTCVKKTFPNFFQKLTAAPPFGLGARVVEVGTGRVLEGTELMAE